MPLNTLRLNHQPSTHPNDRIVFIKPLPRPPAAQHSYDLADTFLRGIAAQCLPIMKAYHLSVTTLEEYEPNREFIGRNFNNGEVIQLVLRTRSGGWVPFNMVQMVMMHELAHNLHMNHGKGFWAERNKFSAEMRGLWARGYTGEGFWGSGRSLESLRAVTGNNIQPSEELADLQVCGGTFRSRRRKRKRETDGQQQMTWKEKQERRIEKKFGKNGQALGEDEDTRMMLEVGKKGAVGGKPRVAKSKRGRELRAAAALARFGTNKKEADDQTKREDGESKIESADEEEYEDDMKQEDARDVNGQRLLDSMGFGMVRVCGEDDGQDPDQDVHVKQEMKELTGLDFPPDSHAHAQEEQHSPPPRDVNGTAVHTKKNRNPIYDIPAYRGSPTPPPSPLVHSISTKQVSKPRITIHRLPTSTDAGHENPRARNVATSPGTSTSTGTSLSKVEASPPANSPATQTAAATIACTICSLENSHLSPTCTVCANVLDLRKDPGHWRCSSEACQEGRYVNAGDCGFCGICGARRERE